MAPFQKYLIVNADDFNLSGGVCRGIIEAIDAGVITSTTVLVTEAQREELARLKKYTQVSIGVHINLTCGLPVSAPTKIKPLCGRNGKLLKRSREFWDRCDPGSIETEIRAQIERFTKWCGRRPSHLDSHHHVHAHPRIFRVMKKVARGCALALRKKNLDRASCRSSAIKQTEFALYRFDPQMPWNIQSLHDVLCRLRPGITELIVHPGRCDSVLKEKSSFNVGRECELEALLSGNFKKQILQERIRLISYYDL
jgi:chitin disaccharide deacetylase